MPGQYIYPVEFEAESEAAIEEIDDPRERTYHSSEEADHSCTSSSSSSSISWPRLVSSLWRRYFPCGLLFVAFCIVVWYRAGHPISSRRSISRQSDSDVTVSSSDHASFFDQPKSAVESATSELNCEQIMCGTVEIPYPFGLSPKCARGPSYVLDCKDKSHGAEIMPHSPSPEPGLWPYLPNVTGSVSGFYYPYNASGFQEVESFQFNFTEVQVLNLTSYGTLIINSTDFKATSCFKRSREQSFTGQSSLVFSMDSPYRISGANKVFVVGCESVGSYQSDGGSSTCGPNSCVNLLSYDFCNIYDCCTLPIRSSSYIDLDGDGIAYKDFENCGFTSILSPSTYQTSSPGVLGLGTYGMEVLWGLPADESIYPNCIHLKSSSDYACSELAECGIHKIDDAAYFFGYFCKCSRTGYEGDGYLNGSQCKDIDECTRPNNCTELATCTNVDGSYYCTCPSFTTGNGFRIGSEDGTGCTYINFCNEEINDCSPGAICKDSKLGHYRCSCPDQLVGDGYKTGTGCKDSNNSDVALTAGVSAGAAGVFALINCVVCIFFYKRWKKRHLDASFGPNFSRSDFLREIQNSEGTNICRLFTYEELSTATNNFSDDKVLGTGGFGTVYEGTLHDGLKVAIKKTKHDVGGARDDTKQFINEVTILSQVNHRNLVKLLGCCLETQVPVLIYEFISNGNLLEHLRPDPGTGGENAIQRPPLDWYKRLKIAVGIAEGLAYLHSGTSPPIYHRDVKTANILLDHKYVAKVADFGLSKFVAMDVTHVSTAIQGTPGYLDPEYFDNYQITDKSDVYSFGIVLFELVTGDKPVDFSRPVKDHNLALRCGRLWQHGRLMDAIDPNLGNSLDSEMVDSILGVSKVAIGCVDRYRENRPGMQEVLESLKSIAKEAKVLDAGTPIRKKDRSKARVIKSVRFGDNSNSEAQPLTMEMSSSQDTGLTSNPWPETGSSNSTDNTSVLLSSSNGGSSNSWSSPTRSLLGETTNDYFPSSTRNLLGERTNDRYQRSSSAFSSWVLEMLPRRQL